MFVCFFRQIFCFNAHTHTARARSNPINLIIIKKLKIFFPIIHNDYYRLWFVIFFCLCKWCHIKWKIEFSGQFYYFWIFNLFLFLFNFLSPIYIVFSGIHNLSILIFSINVNIYYHYSRAIFLFLTNHDQWIEKNPFIVFFLLFLSMSVCSGYFSYRK